MPVQTTNSTNDARPAAEPATGAANAPAPITLILLDDGKPVGYEKRRRYVAPRSWHTSGEVELIVTDDVRAGMEQAQGEYVMFGRPGIIYHEDAFRTLIDRARRYQADVMAFDTIGKSVARSVSLNRIDSCHGLMDGRHMLGKMMLDPAGIPDVSRFMFRKGMLTNEGLEIDSGIKFPGALLVVEALSVAKRTGYIDRVLTECPNGGFDQCDNIIDLADTCHFTIAKIIEFADARCMQNDTNFRRTLGKVMAFLVDDISDIYRKVTAEVAREHLDAMGTADGLMTYLQSMCVSRMALDETLAAKDQRISELESTAKDTARTMGDKDRTIKSLENRVRYLNMQVDELSWHISALLDRGIVDRINNTIPWDTNPEEQPADDPNANSKKPASDVKREMVLNAQRDKAARGDRIIVCVTSYPDRMDLIHESLQTILDQTLPPDEVVLYLAEEQFPCREEDLPRAILKMCEDGLLTVRWCDKDLKSHKRYWYGMQDYPDDIVVFFDDDLVFDKRHMELLYKSYLQHPNAVSAMRTHRITFENGMVAPYAQWQMECSEYVGQERMDLMATEGSGTLWPPHLLPEEAFDLDKSFTLAPNADDIWLKVMQVISGVPVVLAAARKGLHVIPGSQDVSSLWSFNGPESGNNIAMRNLIEAYNEYNGPNDTLLSRLQSNSKGM